MAKIDPKPKGKVIPAPKGLELELENERVLAQKARQLPKVNTYDFITETGGNFFNPLDREARTRVQHASSLGRNTFYSPFQDGTRQVAEMEANKARASLAAGKNYVFNPDPEVMDEMAVGRNGALIDDYAYKKRRGAASLKRGAPLLDPLIANLSIRAAQMFADK